MKTKIALSTGCPMGIGPEIAVKAVSKLSDKFDITLYGDPEILDAALHCPQLSRRSALSESQCGRLSFEALDTATEAVLAGNQDVLVTCPINKHHWNKAGVPFIGHTEYLADKCNIKQYAMMMASPRLKVTLATIHAAIKDVPKLLTAEKIVTAAELTHKELINNFGLTNPRIAVTALNPHCGDGGLLGDEEETLIKPAIRDLVNRNINASGPFPGDSVFAKALEGDFDAVVTMYHDQGLAAIKTIDYKGTVNVTLGLPIIRTSVDHGTAEDIAWQGIADETNLIAAIKLAAKMVENKTHQLRR